MTKDLAKFVVVFSDQLILPYKLWPQLQGVLKHKEDILAELVVFGHLFQNVLWLVVVDQEPLAQEECFQIPE